MSVISVPSQTNYIVAADALNLMIRPSDGAGEQKIIPLVHIAKLLAFFDASEVEAPRSNIPRRTDSLLPFEASGLIDPEDFERWLVVRLFEGDPIVDNLKRFVRAREAYGLVQFVLRSFDCHASVEALANRYGVSAAQFRRLCRKIFGCGLKKQLRQWRAQNALHSVVCGTGTMTEVAYEHGYASASHFAQEIKTHFGSRPGDLR